MGSYDLARLYGSRLLLVSRHFYMNGASTSPAVPGASQTRASADEKAPLHQPKGGYVAHVLPGGLWGRAGVAGFVNMLRTAFPDIRIEVSI